MDILLFSDLHAHNFQYGARWVPGDDGIVYNSRLLDTIDVLKEIQEYAYDNKIKTILFCGDLFHSRGQISVDVYSAIYRQLDSMDNLGLELYFLVGNHDLADRNLVHALTPLTKLGVVVDGLTYSNAIEDVFLAMVPYSDDRKRLDWEFQQVGKLAESQKDNHKYSILLGHCGIQGAKVGSDYVLVSENDIDLSQIPYDKFTVCFFGHYHEHQKLAPNAWYVGATHQHNWGDVGGKRGFIHLTLDENGYSFKHIETKAPKFHRLTKEDLDTAVVAPHDFVQFNTSDVTGKEQEEAKEKLAHVAVLETRQVTTEEDQVEFDLPTDKLTPHALIEPWVASKKSILDEQRLVDLGKRLLQQAEKDLL